MRNIHIRVAIEFRSLINKIRAKELLINGKEVTFEEVTRKIINYLDWEKIWQDEFSKK